MTGKTNEELLNLPCFSFVHSTNCPVEDCPFVRMKKSKRRETMLQEDFIQTIEISGARMLNTINNIVDISKIESGLMKLEEKETRLNEKMELLSHMMI